MQLAVITREVSVVCHSTISDLNYAMPDMIVNLRRNSI